MGNVSEVPKVEVEKTIRSGPEKKIKEQFLHIRWYIE